MVKCTRRFACFLRVLLALRRLDPRKEALLEALLKQAKVTRHPWLVACDANMCPEDFEKESLVPKRTDACSGSGRSVHVQVKRPER